jgi:hypothetical protein
MQRRSNPTRRDFLRTSAVAGSVLAAGELVNSRAARTGVIREEAPRAIPTFHCPGLYWSAPGGRDVQVRYRRQGDSPWEQAPPMRYNPIPDTDEDLADYRVPNHRCRPLRQPQSGPLNSRRLRVIVR